jgi:hypothetical protein
MGVEDELGAVVAELGSGTELPGGAYVNVLSGLGVALKKINQWQVWFGGSTNKYATFMGV